MSGIRWNRIRWYRLKVLIEHNRRYGWRGICSDLKWVWKGDHLC